jgi:hypothetical protein
MNAQQTEMFDRLTALLVNNEGLTDQQHEAYDALKRLLPGIIFRITMSQLIRYS